MAADLPDIERLDIHEVQAEIDLIETEAGRMGRREEELRRSFPNMVTRLEALRRRRALLSAQAMDPGQSAKRASGSTAKPNPGPNQPRVANTTATLPTPSRGRPVIQDPGRPAQTQDPAATGRGSPPSRSIPGPPAAAAPAGGGLRKPKNAGAAPVPPRPPPLVGVPVGASGATGSSRSQSKGGPRSVAADLPDIGGLDEDPPAKGGGGSHWDLMSSLTSDLELEDYSSSESQSEEGNGGIPMPATPGSGTEAGDGEAEADAFIDQWRAKAFGAAESTAEPVSEDATLVDVPIPRSIRAARAEPSRETDSWRKEAAKLNAEIETLTRRHGESLAALQAQVREREAEIEQIRSGAVPSAGRRSGVEAGPDLSALQKRLEASERTRDSLEADLEALKVEKAEILMRHDEDLERLRRLREEEESRDQQKGKELDALEQRAKEDREAAVRDAEMRIGAIRTEQEAEQERLAGSLKESEERWQSEKSRLEVQRDEIRRELEGRIESAGREATESRDFIAALLEPVERVVEFLKNRSVEETLRRSGPTGMEAAEQFASLMTQIEAGAREISQAGDPEQSRAAATGSIESVEALLTHVSETLLEALWERDQLLSETGEVRARDENLAEKARSLGEELARTAGDLASARAETERVATETALLREERDRIVAEQGARGRELTETRGELESLVEERDRLQRDLSQSRADGEGLAKELAGLREERETLVADRESLEGTRAAVASELEGVRAELARTVEERERLSSELAAVRAKADSLVEERDRLLEDLSRARVDGDELARAREDLGKDVQNLREALERLTTEQEGLEGIRAALASDLESARADLAKLALEREALSRDLIEACAEVDSHIAEERRLSTDLERLRAEAEELSKAREALSAEHESLKGSSDTLQSDLEGVRGELSRTAGERDQLARDLENLGLVLDRTVAERESTAGERDRIAKELVELRTERDALAEARDGLLAVRERISKEFADVRHERSRSVEALDQLRAERDALAEQLGAIDKERASLLAERDGLLKETGDSRQRIEEELGQATAREGEQREALSQARAELELLREERDQVRSDLDRVDRALKEAETRQASLVIDLGEAKADGERRAAEFDELLDRTKSLEEQRAQLAADVERETRAREAMGMELAAGAAKIEKIRSEREAFRVREEKASEETSRLRGEVGLLKSKVDSERAEFQRRTDLMNRLLQAMGSLAKSPLEEPVTEANAPVEAEKLLKEIFGPAQQKGGPGKQRRS